MNFVCKLPLEKNPNSILHKLKFISLTKFYHADEKKFIMVHKALIVQTNHRILIWTYPTKNFV